MIAGHMILKAKIMEKLFRRCLQSHHWLILLSNHKRNGITPARQLHGRLNQQYRPFTADSATWKTNSLPGPSPARVL